MECLAGVNVAKPGDDSLVEQERLDRCRSPGEPRAEPASVEIERLRPKRGERRPVAQRVAGDQIERTEPAGVVERQSPALFGLDQQMIVAADIRGVDSPMARHSEVKNHRIAPVSGDQAIFRPPPKARYARPRQALPKVGWNVPPQVETARLDPRKPPPVEHCGESADGGFDFGKLGHRSGDMAKAWQPG